MAVYYVPWDVSKNMLEEAERLCEKAGTFDFLHAKNHHPEFLKHSKEDEENNKGGLGPTGCRN